MNHTLWQMFRSDMIETERADDRPATSLPLVTPQVAATHDQAYVHAHPELYAPDTQAFYYDRTPLPAEWDMDLPRECHVRVFVINAWTIVRVLQTPAGTRLQAPVMEAVLPTAHQSERARLHGEHRLRC